MQQPPGRPPGPPYRPPQPPPGAPGPQPAYGTPPGQPVAAVPAYAPPHRPPKRGAVRFLAGTCIFSAWVTLVLSIILAVGSFGMGLSVAGANAAASRATGQYFPAPPGGSGGLGGLPGLDGSDGLGLPTQPGPAAGLGMMQDVLKTVIPTLCYASGAFTLVTGVVTFLLFLGLGQVCYVLLDLETRSDQMSQTLQLIAARLGAGR